MTRRPLALASVMAAIALCLSLEIRTQGAAATASLRLVDVTRTAGLVFEHFTGAFGKKYLPETLGSGVVVFDADGDSLEDVLLPNGTSWPGQTRPGTATANLKFTTGSGSTVSESLTGSGASASAHSVSLAWNPSSSGAVVGYNVYRGTTTGGPYNKINSSLESSTAFGDANVAAGKTYFYVVTAVDGGGTESGFSNQVKAIIPSP